jgi:hypothetical protein
MVDKQSDPLDGKPFVRSDFQCGRIVERQKSEESPPSEQIDVLRGLSQAISLATSGQLISSKAKFGGMAVPEAQLDLGRPFQEKLSCPFNERRQIFVCEDGALVPEQISF